MSRLYSRHRYTNGNCVCAVPYCAKTTTLGRDDDGSIWFCGTHRKHAPAELRSLWFAAHGREFQELTHDILDAAICGSHLPDRQLKTVEYLNG